MRSKKNGMEYSFAVSSPTGRLDDYETPHGKYIEGSVFTPHGIVKVFWGSKHYELLFGWEGRMYVRNVKSTGEATKVGLTRLAGKWANEVVQFGCDDEENAFDPKYCYRISLAE